MQTVWDPKNSTLEFLAEFFLCGQLSHKKTEHNLRQFKESFMEDLKVQIFLLLFPVLGQLCPAPYGLKQHLEF